MEKNMLEQNLQSFKLVSGNRLNYFPKGTCLSLMPGLKVEILTRLLLWVLGPVFQFPGCPGL